MSKSLVKGAGGTEVPRKQQPARQSPQRRLATIMFTDIVGYSALAQKNETLALRLLEGHRLLLRPVFANHGGREVKTIGDAFLVEFSSALAGARCAIEIQRTIVEHNASQPPDKRLQLRIGLHLSDVEPRGNDLYGDGVNIASQIEPLAKPGGICLSEDVARQIENKISDPVLRLGKSELKNRQFPMAIYRIALPWENEYPVLSQRLSFALKRRNLGWRFVLEAASVLVLMGMIWPGGSDSAPATVPEIHSKLRAFLDDQIPAASLRITYEELHPNQDGPRIVVEGTGAIQREVADTNGYNNLSLAEIEHLVRVLIDMEAWEQRSTYRKTASSEGRAYLRVQVGGASSEIWEWYDELDSNQRIVKLLDQLKKPAFPQEAPSVALATIANTQGNQMPKKLASTTSRSNDSPSAGEQTIRGSSSGRRARALQAMNSDLLALVRSGQDEEVQTFLATGADPNFQGQDDVTYLMEAAYQGHTGTIRVLLNAGAEVNTKSRVRRTALMEAAEKGHTETVQVLLDYGAEVDAREDRGIFRSIYRIVKKGLPFLGGSRQSNSESNSTALMMAANRGHTPTVQVLLDAGAKGDAKNTLGRTPLMMAASGGHTQTVELLLENQVRVNEKDKQDHTALMVANQNGHIQIAQLLMQSGARE